MKIRKNRWRTRWLAGAALAVAAGWSFEAGAQQVRPCSGPSNQPSLVLRWMDAYFRSFYPLDEKSCDEITDKAVDACHEAVSDAQKCVAHVIRSTRRVSKIACDTQGPDENACNDDYKGLDDELKDSLDGETDSAHENCDASFAILLHAHCMNGLP